jgi:CHAT domain-containing protein
MQDHPVSYTHSARFLTTDFAPNNRGEGKNFLGIAPVHFQKRFNQPSLTGSVHSLEKLRSNFMLADNKIFKEASRSNFLQDFGNYKILQLYTHASNGKKEGDPEIYFEDSVLYLSDLLNEKELLTRLIVLSACETGTGQWHGGEGVYSFNRGFAALGIPSTVTNLWAVESKTTYKLTELFYKYLVKGIEIDVALQQAKIEFINTSSQEERLPYYWASAIVSGKTEAIRLRTPYKPEPIMRVLAIIFTAVTLLVIWLNYKSMKHMKVQPEYSF